jgi:thymidine kinase
MTELSERSAAIVEQSAADTATRMTKANRSAMDFVLSAQKAMLEEIVFAGNEMLDRARTETHLFNEFVSKMAGSHSVKDLKTMCEECGQHQIDFIRRDSERLFKHGEHIIENTSKLFSGRPQN